MCNKIIYGKVSELILKYAIKNHKNLYIKLNENGKAITCSEPEKGLFEFSKAKNIVESLSKNLKKLKFRVEAVPDIVPNQNKNDDGNYESQDSEVNPNRQKYEPSENITRWIEKFGVCADILSDAKRRADFICDELYKSDQKLMDILHIIEIEKSKDLYNGWLLYKRIKKNREDRRKLKDELLIVENVLREIDPRCFQRKKIQKAIEGLSNRKYRFRIIEEEQKNVM